MLTVLERSTTLLVQAKIGLMHQGGTLQGMVRAFMAQVAVRDAAMVFVYQRKSSLQSVLVTGMPSREQLADRIGGGWRHDPHLS
jgi:hypothetical protein